MKKAESAKHHAASARDAAVDKNRRASAESLEAQAASNLGAAGHPLRQFSSSFRVGVNRIETVLRHWLHEQGLLPAAVNPADHPGEEGKASGEKPREEPPAAETDGKKGKKGSSAKDKKKG